MANKKKVTTAVVAVAAAAALMLGGTFAWQSISQTALNEASDVINPGGRLHDDFDGSDKNVYVENFAEDEIFARVRFDEYFEIIMNYDADNPDAQQTKKDVITTYVDDEGNEVEAVRENTSTYVTHIFGQDNATDEFWNWTMGSADSEPAYYMPTFNLNKDSLAADVNGVFNGANFTITDKDDGDQYVDTYVEWTDGATKEGYEIYDGDTNSVDELSRDHGQPNELTTAVNYIIDSGDITGYEDNLVLTEEKVAHTAAQVNAETGFISMADWDGTPGPFWVYDTDGWCYWAQPIPGRDAEGNTSTTGLLMDGIALDGVMDDTWYYAINVVAQFVTADDVGKSDGTGFYADGQAPTAAAEALLAAIGVDVSGETATPDDGGNEEITTLVLNAAGDAEVTIERGASVKIEAESDEADLTGVLIDGSAWNESSDWTYDPDTQILTLNGPDSYYGVADLNNTYSGQVSFESEVDGGDDEEDESHLVIQYGGHNGKIWVSDPSVFATSGNGVSFTLYDGETGQEATAEQAEWALTSSDDNEYTSTEGEDGKLLVTVNKATDEITEGYEFKFTLYGTHTDYSDTVTEEFTVIIGEQPEPTVLKLYSEISMGNDVAFFVQSDAEGAAERKYEASVAADLDYDGDGEFDEYSYLYEGLTWTFYQEGVETNAVTVTTDESNISYLSATAAGTYTYVVSVDGSEVTAEGSITFVESAARINSVTLKETSGWSDSSGIKAYMYGKSIGAIDEENYTIDNDYWNSSTGTYTLTLTPGVEFADGTKVDVTDESAVTYSFDWAKNSSYEPYQTHSDHMYEWSDNYAYDGVGLYYLAYDEPKKFVTFGAGSYDNQNPSINDLTVCPHYCVYDGSDNLGRVTVDISVVYEGETYTGELVVGMPYIE